MKRAQVFLCEKNWLCLLEGLKLVPLEYIFFLNHMHAICCAHKVFLNPVMAVVKNKKVMFDNHALHLFNLALSTAWLVTRSQQSHRNVYQWSTSLSAKEKFGHG